MKKLTIFDELKLLFESDEKVNISSQFMINKFLSTTENFKISEVCNKYINRIPNDLLVLIYRNYLKEKRTPWVKYIKKTKEKSPKLKQKIEATFCCNKRYTNQIIQILSKEGYEPENLFGLKNGE